MRAVPIGLGFRIHTGWSNRSDSIRQIIRPKTASKNNWLPNKLDDATADAPIVGDAKSTDLPIRFSVAIQECPESAPMRQIG